MPGIQVNIGRTPFTLVDVYTAESGQEVRNTMQTMMRYRYTVDVITQAGANYGATPESQVIDNIITTCLGEWDTFFLWDPYVVGASAPQVVRFDGDQPAKCMLPGLYATGAVLPGTTFAYAGLTAFGGWWMWNLKMVSVL
jgi:hypothetical protein